MKNQTIFALASGGGKSGVAVFRVSGPASLEVLEKLAGIKAPEDRRAIRIVIRDPLTKEILDDGLSTFFKGPNSFTGEDIVEFHVHGSGAVIREFSKLLGAQINVRLAEAGEFTRRAFENGKLDLTKVEGLADLINAETSAQRRLAIRQLQGELEKLYEGWREKLLRAIAFYEAEIDFSDEEVPKNLSDRARETVSEVQNEIREHLSDPDRGRLVREGFFIAIIGPPNSGKSSLLNRLAKRDVAIVSEKAGTTRDTIEVSMDLGGYSVIFADTAGLRDTKDEIEMEGVRRTLERAKTADLNLAIFDGARWPEIDKRTLDMAAAGNVICVLNKSDLGPFENGHLGKELLPISAKTGDGIAELLDKISKDVAERCQNIAAPTVVRARHVSALRECLSSLESFEGAQDTVMEAEDLRLAARAIGAITGRIDVDEVLGVIFGEFCIGK